MEYENASLRSEGLGQCEWGKLVVSEFIADHEDHDVWVLLCLFQTYINNRPISRQGSTMLSHGDVVRFGYG